MSHKKDILTPRLVQYQTKEVLAWATLAARTSTCAGLASSDGSVSVTSCTLSMYAGANGPNISDTGIIQVGRKTIRLEFDGQEHPRVL